MLTAGYKGLLQNCLNKVHVVVVVVVVIGTFVCYYCCSSTGIGRVKGPITRSMVLFVFKISSVRKEHA